MGRGGRGGGGRGSFGGGGRGGGFSGGRGGSFGGGGRGSGRARTGGSFGSGRNRGGRGSGGLGGLFGGNQSRQRPVIRPRPMYGGGMWRRPFWGGPRYRRGGGCGCSGIGCGSILMGVILLMVLMSILSATGIFSPETPNSVTPSTIEREPLDSGLVNETDYYTDQAGWIENHTTMVHGLRHFYNETGVQPHVYITDNIDGSVHPTIEEFDAYGEDLYEELFTDEAHLLLVFFEPDPDASPDIEPGSYIYDFFRGHQVRSVVDNEGMDILADYIDRYYYDWDLTEEEFFSKSFEEAADRMMEVTRSPWITVWIVIAVVALVFLLFSWWKHRKDQKNREAEQTKEILSQPIETFGAGKEDELTKKYQDDQKNK